MMPAGMKRRNSDEPDMVERAPFQTPAASSDGKAVDLDTITLLLGMMIVVASLRLSGFFAVVAAWVMERAGKPLILLCAVTATSGIFSAFLVNDAICLVLAPLVLER
jgi:Na+/H+ antiporter NhaD/arsenite permease-like protein